MAGVGASTSPLSPRSSGTSTTLSIGVLCETGSPSTRASSRPALTTKRTYGTSARRAVKGLGPDSSSPQLAFSQSHFTPRSLDWKTSRASGITLRRWPKEGVDFAGKRVAVIGTGASGVQAIPTIAREAADLTIFQRTPNWCVPLNNSPITDEQWQALSGARARLHRTLQHTYGGFLHRPIDKSVFDDSPAEREEFWEFLYHQGGMIKPFGNYRDLAVDRKANELFCEFLERKIRARVHDQSVADKLIPNHPYAAKRPPMETNYYEVYNQDNVRLVDLAETPLICYRRKGLETSRETFEADVIVIATGFDAVTGPFNRIDIRGVDAASLRQHWADGPRTHVGILSSGFPNLLMLGGAHSAHGNIPRTTEIQVDWVSELLAFMDIRRYARVETTDQEEDKWTQFVYDAISGRLLLEVDSFFLGANVPGKKRTWLLHTTKNINEYRESLGEVSRNSYERLRFGVSG